MPIFSWFGGKQEEKPPAKEHTFNVKMSCNGCCNAVKKAVEGKGGVHNVTCDLEKQLVTISGWLNKDEAEGYLKASGKQYSAVQ